MVIIRPHGCLRSALLQLRLNQMQILPRFMPTLPFISKLFCCNYVSLITRNENSSFKTLIFSFFRRNQELIKELSTPAPDSKDLHFPTKYSQSLFVQCKANFWKQHLSYWRHSQYNAVRFFMTIVIGVLFGLIFWKQAKNT